MITWGIGLGAGIQLVAQFSDHLREVLPSPSFSHSHMPSAFQRGIEHEHAGRPATAIFSIDTLGRAPFDGNRFARLSHQSLGSLIQAHQRPGGVVRLLIHLQYVFHRRNDLGVGFRRDAPILLQVRLKFVSLRTRCTDDLPQDSARPEDTI